LGGRGLTHLSPLSWVQVVMGVSGEVVWGAIAGTERGDHVGVYGNDWAIPSKQEKGDSARRTSEGGIQTTCASENFFLCA